MFMKFINIKRYLILIFLVAIAAIGLGLQTNSQTVPSDSSESASPSEIITKIEKTWQGQYSGYFQRDFETKGMTGEEISRDLLKIQQKTKKNSAVIWARSNPDNLELFLIMPGKDAIARIIPEANQVELSKTIQFFLAEISRPSLSKRYLTLGKQLHDWLISPIEADLQANRIDTLILCLGGGLRSLPFPALYDGKQFLIEKYSLTRIPGFNLTKISQGDLGNAQVLAMGASQFKEQPALPGVAIEIKTIIETPWKGQSVLNQDFTVENLESLRKKEPFKIIHLATHADFQPGDPTKSYIQFGDRKLTLPELPDLNLNDPPVELLVLSACQTALGDKNVELGFSGLALQGGVKSVLASFWSVSDAGTFALMSEFYQRLKSTLNKAEALQQTQIAMIRGTVYLRGGELVSSRGNVVLPDILGNNDKKDLSHPFYWASFSLIGSPW
jgi:CHAT domain-containing protein